MKKLLPEISLMDRYIGSEIIKSFLTSLFGLVFMFMTFSVLDSLRIETDQPKERLWMYLLYLIPQNTALVMPAALMFSVSYTVAQLTVSRELIAIHSAGISFYRALVTVFITGAVLSGILFLFQNFLVTASNELAKEEYNRLTKNTGTVKDIVWQKNYRGSKGYYFIYYLDRDKDRVLGSFHYIELGENDRPSYLVQGGSASYDRSRKIWTVNNAREAFFDADLKITEAGEHAVKEYSFPEDIDFFARIPRNPGELNVTELTSEIEHLESRGLSSVPYRVQWHASFAFPLMMIFITIVGAISGNSGNIRSGGPMIRSLLLSIGTIFVFQMVFRLGLSLGQNRVIWPFAAGWGPTFLFMAASFYMIWKFRK